ncbi:Perforin-1 [Liparis tanakae]|uniref:Perforin-1 n=1 Tax=Liparis tanakae TaxID=230148 RepID=A0A4Z2EXF0_9TELE|nr:Perforin-1 [Liparis tanakae]
MSRLWHLLLLTWAWSPPCLSVSVGFTGSPRECDQAHFVPGYNLGGEGFDIVTMQRKGAYIIDTETWKLANNTCRMFRNDYANRERQKVPAAVVDWRILPKCSLKVSGTVYSSVESLVNDSTSAVSNDWKIGLKIPVKSGNVAVSFGGSHSKESNAAMQKSKEDHYTFLRHSVDCSFYRLIDTYGTHYITQVSLGGKIKAITSVRTCEATMSGLSATVVSDCLLVEASAGFKNDNNVEAMTRQCKVEKNKLGSGQKFSMAFSERSTDVIGGNIDGADILFKGQSDPSAYNNWINSLKSTPDVVKYSVLPLHTILPSSHSARVGLKQEVEKYIQENAVLRRCSGTCPIGHRSSRRDPCACVCVSDRNVRSNCCPAGRGRATLKVFRLYAKELYGDRWTGTDGSVEVKYGYQIKRTAVFDDDDNPRWAETFEFGPVDLSMRDKLTFSVYDCDNSWDSDLLGQCSFELRGGRVTDSCMLDHGTLFFSYAVECAPSLGGDRCQEYIPSPMSVSLAEVFHTRNGVLLGSSATLQ